MNQNISFSDFLWKDKTNKLILILAFAIILIQLAIFKYFYPSAGFIDGDSYVYLQTAFWNMGINTYMVGYSMFLRLFSVFSKSDFVLVSFQYLFIHVSALLFLFSIFYFFNPHRLIKQFLLLFTVVNPLYLFIANYISSDSLFLSLSLLWFSSLLWIINKPSKKVAVYSSLILFICFTVRYNALFYPFFFVIALCFSKLKFKTKLLSLTISLTLIISFIVYNGNKYKELTGIWQYSPFSGWQLANNAMYAYRFVDSAARKAVPKRFETLDNMVRAYYDTSRNPFRHPEILLKASTVYMWDQQLTLYKYRNMLFAHDSSASELKKWASMGPMYSQYGLYIITNYPIQFLKYFVWPNACKYYAPPVEFLDHYNSGEDSVKSAAVQWFEYKSPKRLVRVKNLEVTLLDYYPILTGISNIIYFFSIICLINLGFFRFPNSLRNSILIVTIFWLGNAIFTILASSAALRFQAFPIILITIVNFVLIDIMYKTAVKQDQDKNKSLKERLEISPVKN